VILSDDICEFLTGGVSIVLASRSAALVPSIARATCCRIVRGELLDDVRSRGMVSATFTRPNTHRAMQFKGSDARIEAIRAEDRSAVAAYLQAFAAVVEPLGFPNEFTRAFHASPADEVAIEFTPAEAFQQTPGPAAGARIA
jgi:hypothetical protein